MKIIILGGGEVGGNLAYNLTKEESDITVVDIDGDRLRDLQDRYDIRTVRGMASHPDVLRAAGAEDADLPRCRGCVRGHCGGLNLFNIL